ncbi:Ankyrin repeat-containing domain [Phytophthora cactorum]|nr:Ankyrin repeat-containing domain [Phytophthora cactorum]
MQQLYDRYPGALDSEVVLRITKIAELPILKWLHKCKLLLFKQFPDCEDNIFMYASLKGKDDVVRWLVMLFPDTVWSLRYAAQGGHLKLLKWLTKHTSWDENSLRSALHSAIEGNHLETAKFLNNLKSAKIENQPSLKLNSLEICSGFMIQSAGTSPTLWFAIRAARNDCIGVLQFMDTVSGLCRNESIYFVGCGNKNPEVVKWYVDHYDNPRKRKY